MEVEKVTRRYEQEQMVQWLEKAVIDSVRGQEVGQGPSCHTLIRAQSPLFNRPIATLPLGPQ